MGRKLRITGLAMLVIVFLVLSACGTGKNSNTKSVSSNGTNQNSGDTKVPLGKKNIKLAYVAWVSATASDYVMQDVLENLGYKVNLMVTSTGTMYQSIAQGSTDAMVCSWLPYTDVSYWKKYKNKVNDLGPNLNKAPIGLVVPKYVKINSVEDLAKNTNNIGGNTNWTITGIDAGSGEMEVIKNKVMPKYGLSKWKLKASSGPAMLVSLKKAIQNHKPIIVTLWSPHWAFGQWDLKYLKDPKHVFSKPDDIHTLTRKGLKKDSPAAYKVLDQFHWTKKDMEKVMTMIHNGMSPKDAAKKWVSQNQALVKKWTKGVN